MSVQTNQARNVLTSNTESFDSVISMVNEIFGRSSQVVLEDLVFEMRAKHERILNEIKSLGELGLLTSVNSNSDSNSGLRSFLKRNLGDISNWQMLINTLSLYSRLLLCGRSPYRKLPKERLPLEVDLGTQIETAALSLMKLANKHNQLIRNSLSELDTEDVRARHKLTTSDLKSLNKKFESEKPVFLKPAVDCKDGRDQKRIDREPKVSSNKNLQIVNIHKLKSEITRYAHNRF
jgi:hypothetical protein